MAKKSKHELMQDRRACKAAIRRFAAERSACLSNDDVQGAADAQARSEKAKGKLARIGTALGKLS